MNKISKENQGRAFFKATKMFFSIALFCSLSINVFTELASFSTEQEIRLSESYSFFPADGRGNRHRFEDYYRGKVVEEKSEDPCLPSFHFYLSCLTKKIILRFDLSERSGSVFILLSLLTSLFLEIRLVELLI